MRDHEHTLFQSAEVLLKPLYGVEVEVVGGLVEQQVIRVTEEGLGQHDAYLLIIRDIRHLTVVHILLDTQVLKQLGCLALGFPAVHLSKRHFQFGSTHTILLAHLGLCIEGLALLHILPQWLMSHQHRVHHREFIVFEVVLLKHTHALARQHLDGTLVGLQLSADSTEQGRLTGTVGTDNSIDVSTCKLQVHVFVENLLTKLNRQIGYCNHFVSFLLTLL